MYSTQVSQALGIIDTPGLEGGGILRVRGRFKVKAKERVRGRVIQDKSKEVWRRGGAGGYVE